MLISQSHIDLIVWIRWMSFLLFFYQLVGQLHFASYLAKSRYISLQSKWSTLLNVLFYSHFYLAVPFLFFVKIIWFSSLMKLKLKTLWKGQAFPKLQHFKFSWWFAKFYNIFSSIWKLKKMEEGELKLIELYCNQNKIDWIIWLADWGLSNESPDSHDDLLIFMTNYIWRAGEESGPNSQPSCVPSKEGFRI